MELAPVSDTEQRVFSALADPQRRAMMRFLSLAPMPVHELAARFEISRPGVSKHLAVLREATLVNETKQGRTRIYEVRREPLQLVEDWLASLWTERLGALADLAEEMERGT